MRTRATSSLLAGALVLAATSPTVAAETAATSRGAFRDVAVADDATLRVYQRGTGGAVVLLHGFALDHREWDEEAAALAERYRVVTYDLRAHGDSSPVHDLFSHLDELAAVLDALKIERATLIGLSAGARIALDFALSRPHRVEALILASPAISGRPPSWPMPWFGAIIEAVRAGDFAGAAGRFAESPLMECFSGPDSAAEVRRMVLDNTALWRSRGDLERPLEPSAYGRLDEVHVPVLAIAGALDPSDSPAVAREIAQRVANAELLVLENAGHLVDFDAPDAFLSAADRFLERLGTLP